MTRIDGNVFAQTTQDMNLKSSVSQQSGAYRGENLVSEDVTSSLLDAAEELSLYVAEKVEHKRFEARKIGVESPMDVMQAEEITAYLDAAKTFDDPQKLVALCKRMQSGQEDPQQLARQETQNPTEQYLLLQYALRSDDRNSPTDTALVLLREAISDLYADHGPQICASLNTISVAAQHGESRENISNFQSTYCDVILGDGTLAQTLTRVLAQVTGSESNDFVRTLRDLIKALGLDLSATRPSSDPSHLHALIQDLYQLEVTATIIDFCKELSQTLAKRHQIADFPALALMKEMIAVTEEKWVSASRFAALPIRFGIESVTAEITLLSAALKILRNLPVKVFPDMDIRQSILVAAQEAVDCAIDKEEQ